MLTASHLLTRAGAFLCATMAAAPVAAQQKQMRVQQLERAEVAADDRIIDALRYRERPTWGEIRGITRDTIDTIPFVMSASGGISLGAYQAGVTWALARFMRHLEADSAYRRDVVRLGIPYFSAATGASAGNINALLSALEWCTPRPSLPEESLFWSIWVSVGWPELFPDHRIAGDARRADIQLAGAPSSSSEQADAGIFDRSFFRDALFPVVEQRMRAATRDVCDGFPIGVTATRVVPTSFPVTERLSAVTQRYAAVFQLSRNRGDDGLVFAQAKPELRDRGMGALLALAVGETNVIPSRSLFTLIEASSAFPVAFSPRVIRYYDAENLESNGFCPPPVTPMEPCAHPQEAYFTDGGVFDNNPLQLALDMHERTSVTVAVSPSGQNSSVTQFAMVPARALYVGTDQFREGPMKEQRAMPSEASPVGGLGAVFQLLNGAVPAARQYEMQTLARSLSRDRVMPKRYIRVTDRYFPLFGEHLGAFGAFLGRPMREWDFYAGIYDGLHFAAADIICQQGGTALGRAGGTHDQCVRDALEPLVGGRVIPLGDIGPYVLADMFRQETGQRLDPLDVAPTRLDSVSRQRVRVLRGLTRAQTAQMSRGDPVCDTRDWAKALLCGGNLDSLIADVRNDVTLLETIESWSEREECRTPRSSVADPCLADPTYVSFVKNPAGEFKHRVGHVTSRLWEVEMSIRNRNDAEKGRVEEHGGRAKEIPEYASWVEFAEFLLRSYDWPARRHADLDPSSIPPETADPGKRFLSSLLPYYVNVGARVAGYEFGWMPLYHLGERFALQAPISIASMRETRERGDSLRYRQIQVGLGILYKPGSLVMPGLGLSVRPIVGMVDFDFAHAFRDMYLRRVHEQLDMVSWELTAYLLAGKLRVSAYSIPHGLTGKRGVGFRSGLADIPGLVYWIWK